MFKFEAREKFRAQRIKTYVRVDDVRSNNEVDHFQLSEVIACEKLP